MANAVIVGVDEAGRGPLAGPVVAGACTDDPRLKKYKYIRDSKILSEHERELAYHWITERLPFGFGIVDNETIDRIGILEATNLAMQQAVAMLAAKVTPTYLLVDGRDAFWFDYPHTSIVRGDAKEKCISASSIVAKVTRDRLMVELDMQFPEYGFAKNKGYGVPQHCKALIKHGPCALHRKSYLGWLHNPSTLQMKAVEDDVHEWVNLDK